jgi:hypothetical protein
MDTFKFPWRVEVRASLFHPWRSEGVYTRLDFAIGASRKYNSRFVRIRAN